MLKSRDRVSFGDLVPGLGATLNEDVIKAHPPTAGHFSLFVEDWQKRQAT